MAAVRLGDAGAWVTTGFLRPGETLQARVMTSSGFATTSTATINIGDAQTTWKVTTRPAALRIFQTSSTFVGSSIGSLAKADEFCQQASNAVYPPGKYKAILSDETTDAKDRFQLVYPIVRADDAGVVVTNVNLWGGALATPISLNDVAVWTGSTSSGTKVPGKTCGSWRDADAGAMGWYGVANRVDAWLSSATSEPCYTERHLYCIEQP
jgi:hypothetical protein